MLIQTSRRTSGCRSPDVYDNGRSSREESQMLVVYVRLYVRTHVRRYVRTLRTGVVQLVTPAKGPSGLWRLSYWGDRGWGDYVGRLRAALLSSTAITCWKSKSQKSMSRVNSSNSNSIAKKNQVSSFSVNPIDSAVNSHQKSPPKNPMEKNQFPLCQKDGRTWIYPDVPDHQNAGFPKIIDEKNQFSEN